MAATSYAPSSGHAESYYNRIKGINFLPITKAGLDHKNPGNWDDYPKLDELTKRMMGYVLSPQTYMALFYDQHTFQPFTKHWLNERWQNVDIFCMNGAGESQLGATKEERETCRLLNYGAGQIFREYITTVNVNILSGDNGKLSNLKSARFMFRLEKDVPDTIAGFIPYFLFPYIDEKDTAWQIYAYVTKQNKCTLLQCLDSQHDEALVQMSTTCETKKFNKMCAW
jgi:hypothetical protein